MSNDTTAKVFRNSDGVCERLLDDASNFSAWKAQVHALLYVADCLQLVLGVELCPSIPIGAITPAVVVNGVTTIAESTAPVDAAVLESATRAIEAWETKSRKAAGILNGSLSAPIQPGMQIYLADPAKMWTVLNDQYDATNDEGMASSIKDQFHCDKLRENERVHAYIARLLNYQHQLAFTDFPLRDTDIASRLLSGLTPAWKQHVYSIRLARQTNNLQ